MPESIEAHRSEVLSETDIDFYDEDDVTFHFNSGREWESEETVEEREDGSTVKKSTICTIPCPHVSIYDRSGAIHAIVHLPMANPIICAHVKSLENESNSFFIDSIVSSLENSYEGIEEITAFSAEDEGLGALVRESLEEGTPESVSVPQPA